MEGREQSGVERRLSRLRVAVIALGVVSALSLVAVGVLAWQVMSLRGTLAAYDQVVSTVGEQGGARDDDVLASGGAHNAPDGSRVSGATSDGADEDADGKGGVDPDNLRAADLLDIIGESWANAQRILDSYGVDQTDLVINTDDGGMVWNPANWTVTLVTDLDEPGRVAVYLRHDSWGLF